MATAAILVPAAPASAATPDRWGFAFVNDPTTPVWTPLDPAYQYGSWKTFAPAALADGMKVTTGRFLVRFPQIGFGSRGIPHVTAVNDDGRFCEAVRWGAPSNFNSMLGVSANSIGGMSIKYPLLHQKETHAQVTAYGDTSNYCHPAKLWVDSGGGTALVTVACFTNAGAPVTHGYLSTFSSSV